MRSKSPAMAVILSAALLVVVATAVDAIRHDSWGPVWAIGWLPAVLLGSLYRPARRCRPFRSRA